MKSTKMAVNSNFKLGCTVAASNALRLGLHKRAYKGLKHMQWSQCIHSAQHSSQQCIHDGRQHTAYTETCEQSQGKAHVLVKLLGMQLDYNTTDNW